MFVWTFWFSIPEKHIYSLKEDTSLSERTSDMYLVTDSFGGNFNCDVAGPLRYLYLLELKEATLYVSRDGQQLYSKITFFKACKQLQFTVTFDIPCAPPHPFIQKKRYQRWIFLLGRDFQLCCKIQCSWNQSLVTIVWCGMKSYDLPCQCFIFV